MCKPPPLAAADAAADACLCATASQYLPKMDLKPADLPCKRPAPYNYERSLTMAVFNGTAWVRPPYVRNKPHAVAYKDRASKAVIWRLRHAPIRGVTPAMVRWMWNHMDKQVADPRDGQKWQVSPAETCCTAMAPLQLCCGPAAAEMLL